MAWLRTAALLAMLVFVSAAASSATALRIASDISYAPLEFYAPHSQRVEGFDYDLAQSLGKKLGRPVLFANHAFNTMIDGLSGGKFDLVISAMSDTRAREKQVDFIDYFLAGSGILVHKGNPEHIFNLAGLCGMTVDLEKGTAQEAAVKEQSAKCVGVGLGPISILSFTSDGDALRAFLAGKSMAHISDYPVVAYLARTLDGGNRFEVGGRQFGVVPYGIAVSKKNPSLRNAVQSSLAALVAAGAYERLLKKWGLGQGALRSAPINAGTLF
ncbi:MAG: ABC transporter substrate-binding protein [Candidatus Eremiobacteraeota bacterium]|nr:ABC transporter substrate-binding protein [Candidatus Eremiobacteraeota bacterium]